MVFHARSLLLVLMFLGGLPTHAQGAPEQKQTPKKDDYYELYKILADTVDQVDRNYVKEVGRRELIEAAVKGVMSRLDPYSVYIGPEELSQFRSTVESEFGGIGIHISTEDGDLRVLSPIYGTPAYRAGVQAGDRILEIDGKSTEGLLPDDAIARMKGKEGTRVTLTLVHPATTKREKVTLLRERIHVETVLGDRRKTDDTWDFMFDRPSGIGYLRVTAFSRDTASELRKALQDLQVQKCRGLIVDLRFNPGGLLSSAIEVSNLFISKGRIVSTKGRNTPERVWDAHQEGAFEGFPVVILVNRYSASASEIVSACLQDHKRAVIMGERTWGKGSVQNIIELENGRSALKLTTAAYCRPSGRNIHRFPDSKEADVWGVLPDPGFDLRLAEREISALLADRRQRDILLPSHPPATKPEQTAAKPSQAAPRPSQTAPKPSQAAPKPEKPAAKPGEPEQPAPATPDEMSKPNDPPRLHQGVKPVGPATATDTVPPAGKRALFVDRQLDMAMKYLRGELARAK